MLTTTVKSSKGMTAIELVVVLALTASLTVALTSGLAPLRRATTLESARQRLRMALRQAAAMAYCRGATVELRALADGSGMIISGGASEATTIELPRGVRLLRGPRRGGVRFFGGGLAENATFVVALDGSGEERAVVVNQRGTIR